MSEKQKEKTAGIVKTAPKKSAEKTGKEAVKTTAEAYKTTGQSVALPAKKTAKKKLNSHSNNLFLLTNFVKLIKTN